MYLWRELKTPDERYAEIYGFDESKARGRPTEHLEEYANIQENIKDYEDASQTYGQLTLQIETLTNLRDLLSSGWSRVGIYEFLRDAYDTPPTLDLIKIRKKLIHLPSREYINSLTISSDIEKDIDAAYRQREEPSKAKKLSRMEDWYSCVPPRRDFTQRIVKLESRRRQLCRLTHEVAYLQACSEFYLLRQQEELETRIAIEQARCFRRKMGPTVNEMEMAKEQVTLNQWRASAERQQTLMIDARRTKSTMAGVVEEDTESPLEEVQEEELNPDTQT